jgi:hypothetical protein
MPTVDSYSTKPRTSNNQAKGLFDKRDFIYVAEDDEYQCPAGARLRRRTKTHPNGLIVYRYWTSVCGKCALKPQCTTGKERRVSRRLTPDLVPIFNRNRLSTASATSRHADIGPDRTVATVYLKCMFVSGTIPPIAYVHNVTSPHAFCSLVRPNTSDRAALKSREIIVRERIVDESVPLLPHL